MGCSRNSIGAVRARWVAIFLISAVFSAVEARADFCPDEGTVHPTSLGKDPGAPFAAISCDLNGDGRPDIVTANADTDDVSVLLFNPDSGTFDPPLLFPAGDEPVDIICCDVDNDSDPDLIVANRTASQVNVLRNDGTGQFVLDDAGPYGVGLAPWGVRCVHVNADGLVDLVTANFTGESVTVLLNDGAGEFGSREDYPTLADGTFGLAACDADGDGLDDVIVSNIFSRNITVFENNGDGTLTHVDSFLLDNMGLSVFPWGIDCCLLDGDDKPDVVSADGGNDRVTLISNTSTAGAIQFSNPRSVPAGDDPFRVACGDLGAGSAGAGVNRALDVASANLGSDDISVFVNEGDGTLTPLLSLPVGSNPGSVAITDIDLDGDADVLAPSLEGALVFENDCGVVCGDGACQSPDEDVCTCSQDCGPPDETEADDTCDDGLDNDCDGLIDCDDPDCCGTAPCCEASETSCEDGCDNDCDGLIDCEDPDCCGTAPCCEASETSCEDGCDNDCDGLTDCGDPDCCFDPACPPCPCEAPTVEVAGSRYLDVTPHPDGGPVALRINGADPQTSCVVGYLGLDGVLQAAPTYALPEVWGTVHARGEELAAGRTYEVRADCDPTEPGSTLTSAVTGTLWNFGDTNGDLLVGIIDVVRVLDGFRGIFTALPCSSDADCVDVIPHERCDLSLGRCVWVTVENVDTSATESCLPERIITIGDALTSIDAFRGVPNPCRVSCP